MKETEEFKSLALSLERLAGGLSLSGVCVLAM